jgi:pimeloyl-ACP methyl ester carboxylesterase
VGRVIGLILLVIIAGSAIWAVVTNQRIDLTETTTVEELDRTEFMTAQGVGLNADRAGTGERVVVLLHDVDVAGGVLWDGVVSALGDEATTVRVDLPGFGLSDRLPEEGSSHTVAEMAEMVAEMVRTDFAGQAVTFAGVGLGGEVAAEVAVSHADLVAGLVMVDVDYWLENGWVEFVERLPFYGRPAVFAFETGGPFAAGRWAPNCESGGWCPTRSQIEARDLAETIVDTADSIRSFRRTPPASLVPSKLGEIVAPTRYVWSQEGSVPRESVDRVLEALPEMEVEVVPVWKAHLEEPAVVADAIRSFSP